MPLFGIYYIKGYQFTTHTVFKCHTLALGDHSHWCNSIYRGVT